MNDIDTLTAAIESHAGLAIFGAVLLIIVSLGQQPAMRAQWERIPAAYRPLVPIVLGLCGGVGEALTTGRPWLPALLRGAMAGMPALLAALPSQVVRREPEVVVVNGRPTEKEGE